MIIEDQAVIVKQIFDWYLEGYSIVGLIKLLHENNIPSPRGKEKWSKRSLETMLSNEKYIGNVHLFSDNEFEDSYLIKDNHPPIITGHQFGNVQQEKMRRSNVVKTIDGKKRKSRKYSSKNNNADK